jgi:DNA-directed RNA polymerase subunit M/transcription elongation factor TFIIS
MKTLIDWTETRRCEPCGARNERMVLICVSNLENTQTHDIKKMMADQLMHTTGQQIRKIFQCPNCGLKVADGGALP